MNNNVVVQNIVKYIYTCILGSYAPLILALFLFGNEEKPKFSNTHIHTECSYISIDNAWPR